VCGVANIHRVEICYIGSRGTAGEFVSVSQVIFTPIVVFIEKIGPHPTSLGLEHDPSSPLVVHRVEICCIGNRGTVREFVSVSQAVFTPIVMFIEKIGPHPTSLGLEHDPSTPLVALHPLIYLHSRHKQIRFCFIVSLATATSL
jgi:hypothetical protein